MAQGFFHLQGETRFALQPRGSLQRCMRHHQFGRMHEGTLVQLSLVCRMRFKCCRLEDELNLIDHGWRYVGLLCACSHGTVHDDFVQICERGRH